LHKSILIRHFLAAFLFALFAGTLMACSEDAQESPADHGTPSIESTGQHGETKRAPLQGSKDRPRGMWVLCEGSQRVLEHPERFPELLRDAQALGVSDLFVQVYRGGRAWFHSSTADEQPYRDILERTGKDSFADLIEQAHAAGLRVHAWVNVLSLANNRDAPIVAELGKEVVSVDRHGRSILDYPGLELPEAPLMRMGTPAVWLDPAAPEVVRWLERTFKELVLGYPTLDGLHFDYIRYPDVLPFSPGSSFQVGMDFGYALATRQRFAHETGLTAPFGDRVGSPTRWDAWRRDQLSALVARLGKGARAAQPDLLLSAAVIAYPARAYLSMYQDWRRWLDDGLLDFAVPMLYTLDDRLLRYESASDANGVGGDRVWIGLGTWLFGKSPERAVAQIEIVREAGAYGDALFSWDSIAERPKLRDALAEAVRREDQTTRAAGR